MAALVLASDEISQREAHSERFSSATTESTAQSTRLLPFLLVISEFIRIPSRMCPLPNSPNVIGAAVVLVDSSVEIQR